MPFPEQKMTSVELRIIEELTFIADRILAMETQLQQIHTMLRTEGSLSRETLPLR